MSTLTRNDLFTAVWSYPLTTLAKQWGSCPIKLAALCDDFQIPRPISGYWTQARLGKSAQRPVLPNSAYPTHHEITLPIRRSRVSGQKKTPVLKVPSHITRYEPAVQRAKHAYNKPRINGDAHLWSRFDPDVAALTVSRGTLTRALRILNTLYKFARENAWTSDTELQGKIMVNRFYINGESIRFRLRERLKQHKKPLSSNEQIRQESGAYVSQETEYHPTGLLFLSIEYWASGGKILWEDKDLKPLESCLGDFVTTLVSVSKYLKNHRQVSEVNDRRQQHQQKVMRAFTVNSTLGPLGLMP